MAHFCSVTIITVSDHKWDEFAINLAIEEQRGDFVITPFVHEEVDDKWVNGVAFARLASIDEVIAAGNSLDDHCHLVTPKRVEFKVPAVNPGIITKMPSWRDVMNANAARQKTGKLTETMTSFAVDAKSLPMKKVYFNIGEEDVKLSNKFFTESKGETTVDHIKVPFVHSTSIKGTQYKSMEVLLIWRLCFEGTERPKGDTANNTKKNTIDEICDLMAGL